MSTIYFGGYQAYRALSSHLMTKKVTYFNNREIYEVDQVNQIQTGVMILLLFIKIAFNCY